MCLNHWESWAWTAKKNRQQQVTRCGLTQTRLRFQDVKINPCQCNSKNHVSLLDKEESRFINLVYIFEGSLFRRHSSSDQKPLLSLSPSIEAAGSSCDLCHSSTSSSSSPHLRVTCFTLSVVLVLHWFVHYGEVLLFALMVSSWPSVDRQCCSRVAPQFLQGHSESVNIISKSQCPLVFRVDTAFLTASSKTDKL